MGDSNKGKQISHGEHAFGYQLRDKRQYAKVVKGGKQQWNQSMATEKGGQTDAGCRLEGMLGGNPKERDLNWQKSIRKVS